MALRDYPQLFLGKFLLAEPWEPCDIEPGFNLESHVWNMCSGVSVSLRPSEDHAFLASFLLHLDSWEGLACHLQARDTALSNVLWTPIMMDSHKDGLPNEYEKEEGS